MHRRLHLDKMKYYMLIGIMVLLLVNFAFASATNLNSGLVGYFTLNETTGTLFKNSLTSGSNGTLDGTMQFVAGKIGGAANTTGTGDILFGTPADLNIWTNNYTFSFWVRMPSSTEYKVFFCVKNDTGGVDNVCLFRNNIAGKISLSYRSSETISFDESPYEDLNWFQITITQSVVGSNKNISIYANGVLQSNAVYTDTVEYSTLRMGRQGNNANYFNGAFDEIGMWNRSLTTSEISNLYNNGNGVTYSNVPSSILNSPTDQSSQVNSAVIFNSTGSSFSTLINATLYIWNSSGAPKYTNAQIVSGAINTTLWNNISLSNGAYVWNVNYCDSSSCNFATSNYTLSIGLVENSQTYSSSTLEATTETFSINITTSYVNIIANLVYNNTSYNGVVTNIDGNTIATANVNIPITGASAPITNTFYWRFTLVDSFGAVIYINSASHTQTVNPIVLIPCNSTYNVTTLNITTYEEATFLLLNTSLALTLNYGNLGQTKTLSFFNNSGNLSNYQLCISPASSSFTVDGIISYSKTGYDPREYYYTNFTFTNQTQNLNLYLLATNSSDIFTFTVLDENDNPLESAYIYIQRWDIGTNNHYTVGMVKTGNDGKGIINLRLNDAFYRYVVVYNGITYLITDDTKESATSRTLRIYLAVQNPFAQFNNINYALTFNNNTNVYSLVYADTTGGVETGCLRVSQLEGNSTSLLSYSCINTASGTIAYPVTQNGTVVAEAIFILTPSYNSVQKVVDTLIETIGVAQRFLVIGHFGEVGSLILIGTLAMVGVFTGSILLGGVLVIAGTIVVNLLGLLNIGYAIIIDIAAIVLIIVVTSGRKY